MMYSTLKKSSVNDNMIESIKQKLNATNIVTPDVFSSPLVGRGSTVTKASYVPESDLSFKDNYRYNSLQAKIKEAQSEGLKLMTQQKELDLKLKDQLEAQRQLQGNFGGDIEAVESRMEELNKEIENLGREVEDRTEKFNRKEQANSNMESELNELLEENKTIESELKRLGEKTTSKLNEMQKKMQTSLNDFESLKERHNGDLEKQRQLCTDKIKRIEDDFQKKLASMSDKLNEQILIKQNTDSELMRLQDAKRRAEVELESKMKIIKEQYYEDAFNRARGLMKIHQNRLRTATDSKETLARKQNMMLQDCELLEQKVDEETRHLAEENEILGEKLRELRENITGIQKDLETVRSKNRTVDSDTMALQSEIQKEKYNYKKILENGKFKIRDVVEKYRTSFDDGKHRLQQQQAKVHAQEEELTELRQKFEGVSRQNQNLVDSIRSQLSKNINQTFNEHKDLGASSIKEKSLREKSFNAYN